MSDVNFERDSFEAWYIAGVRKAVPAFAKWSDIEIREGCMRPENDSYRIDSARIALQAWQARALLAVVSAPAAEAMVLPTVQLIGVKDGMETDLDQVPMPPTMKARELLRSVGFTGLDDDDGDGAYAMVACEQLIEYCQTYYGQHAQADSRDAKSGQLMACQQTFALYIDHVGECEGVDFLDDRYGFSKKLNAEQNEQLTIVVQLYEARGN